jgi:cation:H+ antiporter
MLVITIFASLLILDGQLSRLDGVLLLFGFVVYNGFFYWLSQQEDHAELDIIELPDGEISARLDKINVLLEVGRVIAGSVVLVVGAQLMVEGATSIARAIGVSDLVIGVTMVAFGTSLPELATSITAALKGESDIAVGNVIGSNVANLLLVLGATASIATIDVGQTDLDILEFVVMLGISVILWGFSRNHELSRWQSLVFLGIYIAFIVYSFFGAASGITAI